MRFKRGTEGVGRKIWGESKELESTRIHWNLFLIWVLWADLRQGPRWAKYRCAGRGTASDRWWMPSVCVTMATSPRDTLQSQAKYIPQKEHMVEGETGHSVFISLCFQVGRGGGKSHIILVWRDNGMRGSVKTSLKAVKAIAEDKRESSCLRNIQDKKILIFWVENADKGNNRLRGRYRRWDRGLW